MKFKKYGDNIKSSSKIIKASYSLEILLSPFVTDFSRPKFSLFLYIETDLNPLISSMYSLTEFTFC